MQRTHRLGAIALAFCLASPAAFADAVTDWNTFACDLVIGAKMVPPPANRTLAIMHTSIYDATNAITQRHAVPRAVDAAQGASVDAAVAAASHTVLTALMPANVATIDAEYNKALAGIEDTAARDAGIAAGKQAAERVLAARADDGVTAGETYQPFAQPGVYVPTALPAALQWPGRRPWLMSSASQFRPGPPPDLKSAIYARDYNEIKALGGKTSTQRTPAQTEQATFWEATLPSIYHGIVGSVAKQPGRDVTDNARLYMAVTQAVDDALIAVFDAKYHYNFWRPITAIRNGDKDGNDATERDASWVPFIDTPMHPEYPCAHCIVSGAVGAVLKADIGDATPPLFETSSYTAKGAMRSWKSIDEFTKEVSEARIYDGVHFRTSTETGRAMGEKIGALAAEKYLGVK
jgi:hypothetical protein